MRLNLWRDINSSIKVRNGVTARHYRQHRKRFPCHRARSLACRLRVGDAHSFPLLLACLLSVLSIIQGREPSYLKCACCELYHWFHILLLRECVEYIVLSSQQCTGRQLCGDNPLKTLIALSVLGPTVSVVRSTVGILVSSSTSTEPACGNSLDKHTICDLKGGRGLGGKVEKAFSSTPAEKNRNRSRLIFFNIIVG